MCFFSLYWTTVRLCFCWMRAYVLFNLLPQTSHMNVNSFNFTSLYHIAISEIWIHVSSTCLLCERWWLSCTRILYCRQWMCARKLIDNFHLFHFESIKFFAIWQQLTMSFFSYSCFQIQLMDMIRVRQILDTFLAPFSLHHMIIIIFDWVMRNTQI